MLMVQVRVVVVLGMPTSICMLSSEDSNIEQRQINMIEVFNKLSNVTKATL